MTTEYQYQVECDYIDEVASKKIEEDCKIKKYKKGKDLVKI